MAISKSDIFHARLSSIKSTIEKSDVEQRKDNIALQIGESFNELVSQIAQSYPDIKDALPKPITSSPTFKRFRKSDINYLDLEMLVETVSQLLHLVEG